jgi:hypothetical protein
MTISLPSKEIYAVDVPEVREFSARFQYNFFTPDESVSETGGLPTKILEKTSGEIDSSYIHYATTRAPRMVVFNFKLPRLSDPGGLVSDVKHRNDVFSSRVQNGSLIADNVDKVINEDTFSSNQFVSVNFHDGEIDDKIHYLVSGSYVQHTLDQQGNSDIGHYKAAQRLSALTPSYIKPHFLFKAMTLPSRAHGTRFFDSLGQRIFDSYFRRLKDVVVNVQVNGKLFHDITNRTIRDPHAPFATDLHNMHKFTKKLQHQTVNNISSQVSESDFKTFVPFIDIRPNKVAYHHDYRGAEIVGYIIDKIEQLGDGQVKVHDPIIIDNPLSNTTIDFKIKYNTNYIYVIRTVAQFIMPAINDDTGEVATLKILVSSKPSNKVYVTTTEIVAPPPPTALDFTWNYERINPITAQHDHESDRTLPGTGRPGSLLIHWVFPTNSQRDIKKFQLFRRASTNDAFELIKMYDFDDSMIRFSNIESPNSSLIEYVSSPCTFFYDDDFLGPSELKESSRFIYAAASIDAHGFTSNYSAQFEVWFDRFKNRLEKRLISHAGAPKPYPNLYLEADTFVDTIRVSGPHSKRMKLYFNPEFYTVTDDQGRLTRVLATKQTGGKYQMNFINIDNQKEAFLNVLIDDQVSLASKTLSFPEVRFGPHRRSGKKA